MHCEARLDGDPLELTAKEFELLSFLARHAGKTCTHQMILAEVWGRAYSERGAIPACIHAQAAPQAWHGCGRGYKDGARYRLRSDAERRK